MAKEKIIASVIIKKKNYLQITNQTVTGSTSCLFFFYAIQNTRMLTQSSLTSWGSSYHGKTSFSLPHPISSPFHWEHMKTLFSWWTCKNEKMWFHYLLVYTLNDWFLFFFLKEYLLSWNKHRGGWQRTTKNAKRNVQLNISRKSERNISGE